MPAFPGEGTSVGLLFTRLASSLGRETATRELKWMKHALIASGSPTLPAMLQRRLRGEPLQYILGVQTALRVRVPNPHPDPQEPRLLVLSTF
jgi:methylase of polypeptide subunit release factors